jgi:hypothetical protein
MSYRFTMVIHIGILWRSQSQGRGRSQSGSFKNWGVRVRVGSFVYWLHDPDGGYIECFLVFSLIAVTNEPVGGASYSLSYGFVTHFLAMSSPDRGLKTVTSYIIGLLYLRSNPNLEDQYFILGFTPLSGHASSDFSAEACPVWWCCW